MDQLKIKRPASRKGMKKFKRPCEHLVSGSLGWQCEIQPPVPKPALQLKMYVKRGFRFPFAHRRLKQQNARLIDFRNCFHNSFLKWSGGITPRESMLK